MAYEELHHGAEMLGFWLGEGVLVYLTTHGYVVMTLMYYVTSHV